MTKAHKEILQTYRKLQHEFDEAISYPDWIGRRCRVLSETSSNVPYKVFLRLSDSIYK